MKKRTFILFSIIALLLLCTVVFVGCKDEEKKPISLPGEDDSETPVSDGTFPIFSRPSAGTLGEYSCTFVLPDEPTDSEQSVANKFKSTLSSRTLNMNLSFIKASELTDAHTHAVLIGNTGLAESTAAYAALEARQATISVSNNRLVIAFGNITSGYKILDALFEQLVLDTSNKLSLATSFSASCSVLPDSADLPSYPTQTTLVNCGDSTKMLCATSTVEQFKAYCNSLESVGFKKTNFREAADNIFYTFEGETEYVYAYVSNHSGKNQVKIVSGPLESFAPQDFSTDAAETATPYIASIPLPDNGLGYIFRLPDGRFIIHDGGHSGNDRVYKALRELVPEGDIVIAAWFISHPHGDHYPALIDFGKDHRNDKTITVESIMLNMGDPSSYIIKTADRNENCSEDVRKINSALSSYFSNVPVYKVHTGQVFKFGSVEVEVLYTVEDIFPKTLPNVNDSSLVIRMDMGGSSILLLADTCYDSGPIMTEMWGDYLKSDILQVAHHAQWPAEPEIYHCIQAEVLLIPAVSSRLSQYLLIKEGTTTQKAFLKYAKDIYISGDRMQVINLPYVMQNNRDTILLALNPDLADKIKDL